MTPARLTPVRLTHETLTVPHGFFTRQGGVSTGPYASLNANFSGGDDPAHVRENRALVAASLGLPPTHLLGLKQVHGTRVIVADAPWPEGAGADADALVTRTRGLALGVITADCAPVLFADATTGVVGAAHAGWRGAAAGVLEATAEAMRGLGARRISAVIGPCIGAASYEVGPDLRGAVLAASPWAAACFYPGRPPDRAWFDLAAYCAQRLKAAGLSDVAIIQADTCADPDRFFSHRRRTLRNEGPIGHQISAIACL